MPFKISRNMLISLIAVALFGVVNLILFRNIEAEDYFEKIGVILAAGLTLCAYSFLYKDNPFFKLAEHIFLGATVGYLLTITVHQYFAKQVYTPLIEPLIFPDKTEHAPQWAVLIPVTLGILLLLRIHPKCAWLSRYPFALMVGWGAGLMIPQVVDAFIFKQAQASMAAFNRSPNLFENMSTVVTFLGVTSVLIYFFFSVRQEGIVRKVSLMGAFFLMVSFGATFGFTVMARISLLTGRMEFLLNDWLGFID